MDRCWLKGGGDDALHAVLCAPGLNIHRPMRAIARLGRARRFFVLAILALRRSQTTAPMSSLLTVGTRAPTTLLRDRPVPAWAA